MATSAVEKQTDRWRSVWQCLFQVDFVGSWLAGNTHLNTDSTEQQLGGKAFCAVVFPLVNLGRSGALTQLRPNQDELPDQTRATWFLTGPQSSHQPLRLTDKAAAADRRLGWSCRVIEIETHIHVSSNTFRLVVNLVAQTVICCWTAVMKRQKDKSTKLLHCDLKP